MLVLDGGLADERAATQHRYGADCWQCHQLRGYGAGGERETGEV